MKALARTGDRTEKSGRLIAARHWLASVQNESLHLPIFDRGPVPVGWSIERRVIPDDLLYFVVKNSCAGRVGGRAVELAVGSFLWVPAGVPFELSLAAPRRPITLLRFRLRLAARSPINAAVVLHHAWELRASMEGVLDELSTSLPFGEERLRAHLVTLFTGVFRMRAQTGKRDAFTAAQAQQLVRFAAAHLHERPGPAQLARELRLSHDYFSRRFRHTFGLTPRAWLVRERVQHAANRLLDSNVNASELADELGYLDIFAFSRQFKKVMGSSPGAYRQMHLNPPGE